MDDADEDFPSIGTIFLPFRIKKSVLRKLAGNLY